jgi:DNA-binding CsgD family transcriptional regulator
VRHFVQLQTVQPIAKLTRLGASVIGEFGHSVTSCTTLNGVRETFRKEVARHGYSSSACRAFTRTDGASKSQILFRDWPKGWAELSDQKGYAANSPIVAAARSRLSSFTWLDTKSARRWTAAEQVVMDSAFAWGWCDGFVLPVHGPGGYFATVSMATSHPDLDQGPEQRLRLRMIAMMAHERSLALANLDPPENQYETMSARELECLRWVADGKTDWEIGLILSISAATVKFHVDGARKKLRARNRAQAVARLVLTGLY